VRQSSQSMLPAIALSLQRSLMALPCSIILVSWYHGQLRGNPISLLKLVGCRWISVASFTKQFMQPVILASTAVSLKLIWCPSVMLCSAITSLFGWYNCMCCTCSLHPIWIGWLVCLAPFTQDTVYAWDPNAKVIFHWYHINPWQWSLWNSGYQLHIDTHDHLRRRKLWNLLFLLPKSYRCRVWHFKIDNNFFFKFPLKKKLNIFWLKKLFSQVSRKVCGSFMLLNL
jgi:hypothetical protein